MVLVVKKPAANSGDITGSIPGSERSSGEGNGLPTPVFLLGQSHGQRSLVGFGPWGHKELDRTEAFSACRHLVTYLFNWASQMALVVKNPPAT